MSKIIAYQEFKVARKLEEVKTSINEATGCLHLWNVKWHESFLSEDGTKMICYFDAPDAEAVRTAVRQGGPPQTVQVWPGTVHEGPSDASINVVVERNFDEVTSVEAVQAIEDKGAWCLDMYQVVFIRTYFSADKKRMVCLYNAPDAESVRVAQQKANMPVSAVWPCHVMNPSSI